MSNLMWLLLAVAGGFIVTLWVIRMKLLGKPMFPQVSIANPLHGRKWWLIATIIVLTSVLVWYFWHDLASLQKQYLPDVPMWWYLAGFAGLIIIVWLFKMDKEQREKSIHLAEWLIGFAAIGGALAVFYLTEKENVTCPEKPSEFSVPATGRVVDLYSCWGSEVFTVDLREVGVPQLSFNEEIAALKYRAPEEFVVRHESQAGMTSGFVRYKFAVAEMQKLGIPKLSIFVSQTPKEVHLSDEQLDAFTK